MKPRSFPLTNGLNPIYRLIVYLFALPSVAAVPIGFPGGVVEVIVPPSTTTVSLNDIPQLRLDNRAIVALPLTTIPGDYVVIAHAATSTTELLVTVMAKTYREQHLTVENPRLVDPLASDLQRIEAESLQMRRAYNLVSRMPTQLRPIRLPVQGVVTSEFGFRRFFNGQPRNPHSGVDIAAAQGTPVKSPARGVVVVVGNFFFNGNTVLVDHGGGFISMLCHLSEVNVKQQQRIEKDSIIGTVGATGRATGPHLHWSVSLQGTRVDPLVFVDVINASANAE